MNDNAALNLIRNTFENSFDRERFLIFAKNLFHFLDTDTFIYRGNLIPDAYDAHIKTLERLGKYEDVDGHKIEVLAVCLNKQSALERARTLQRNFIAWYLNGSRGGITKDAALVAFYTKDSDDWRLSLVKMDYHLGESKAGKIKAITELTPARRFSFLVGANENTHTAQRQLLPILKDTDFRPALTGLESAFSVEVVTKDFFEKYKKLFLDTKEALDAMVAKDEKIKADFQEKNIDTTDFAKKLLGQIVFLYFLQKKGWFGVARDAVWGTGPKDFLRRLFEKAIAPYDNFFNDTLEPLFYEALAVERTDDFYSKFNCKIPFLNGGLFDPLGNYDWVHTDICLPDDLFSNSRKTKEGDTGDGILDVFDRYNFTVKEDEPLEREVAVDPEMLGKVFENLLEVKDRKSKGTYYTPREIVHYMCQESLINYLLTELNSSSDGGRMDSSEVESVSRDDIETLIRLGETAIEYDKVVLEHGEEKGRYTFKLPQSIRDNANLLDEKLEKIHVCDPAVGSGAFLVGMMTEVIRVRSVLTNYLSDNGRSIYDFKRHAIQNCLYGVDIDPGAVEIAKLRLWLSLIVDEQDIKQIKPLPNLDYKIVCGNSLLSVDKQNLFVNYNLEQIEKLKETLFNETNSQKKQEYREQINKLIVDVTDNNKAFDFEIYFSEVFEDKNENKKGFDVVIANPPYVSYYSRESAKTIVVAKELKILRERFDFTKYERKTGRLNLWMFFVEKFVKLLRVGGVTAFIVDVNFTKDLAKNLRRYLQEKISIKEFVHDLSEFEYVASGQVILIAQKDDNVLRNEILIKDSLAGSGTKIQQSEVGAPDYSLLALTADPIIIKLSSETKLGELPQLQLTTGIQIGGVEIYKGKRIKDYFYRMDWDYKKVFPAVDPKSVRRYSQPKFERGIVFDYELASKITEATEKSAVVLRKYKAFLNREKIFIRQSASKLLATRGTPETCGEYSLFSLISNDNSFDINYLLALLNSKLYTYFAVRNEIILMKKGTQPQIRKSGLEKLPVKKVPFANQKLFIDLVDKILALTVSSDYLTSSEKQAKVKEYEEQIDQLVYKLYGLTPEEITIVEGRSEN